ncbi:uncharacterized protein METZ01_LOCUS193754, partial [marine metagenome]
VKSGPIHPSLAKELAPEEMSVEVEIYLSEFRELVAHDNY